ncbi:hypothetical protein D3C80_2108730 [compost metagenome]
MYWLIVSHGGGEIHLRTYTTLIKQQNQATKRCKKQWISVQEEMDHTSKQNGHHFETRNLLRQIFPRSHSLLFARMIG